MKPVSRHTFALLLAAALAGCATVPETGRQQLRLIDAKQEMQLGLTEFERLKKSTPPSRDTALNELVRRVGGRIAAVAPLKGAQWEFVLFDDPKTANAFCLPGGKVGIYSGILAHTRDEAGLATVIGHEVAHAVAHHGAERISEGLLVQLGGQALEQALKTQAATTQALVLGAYGIGSQIGVVLPHSRAHELEADHLGLLYMARAGYDPRAAVAFWQRFAAGQKDRGIEWLGTHPPHPTRVQELERHMPRALEEYHKTGQR
jgi:predicted Zn-dependent protease